MSSNRPSLPRVAVPVGQSPNPPSPLPPNPPPPPPPPRHPPAQHATRLLPGPRDEPDENVGELIELLPPGYGPEHRNVNAAGNDTRVNIPEALPLVQPSTNDLAVDRNVS